MIRVAILGAGIGREHLAAFRKLPDEFEVAMIVDQDPARAESLRSDDKFTVKTDLQASFDDAAIDVIDICLPPHLHVCVSLRALKAGKHVICEKPLATSLADIERLRAAMHDNGKSIFPVFQYRWGPSLAQLRGLVSAGLVGKPQVAAIETHWSRGSDYYAVPWRGTWGGEQGGAVLGHAIHNHDLMTHFMGPVASVFALTATRVNPIETEDCAAVSFKMTNGALATSSITLGAARDETRMRFVFETLTATSASDPYAPGAAPWSFVARDPMEQAKFDAVLSSLPAELAGFEGFFHEIAMALSGRKNKAVSFDDGAASIELVTAIYDAARSGQRVDLPLGDTHPLFEGWQP
ncbi:MAG: Gfo/Idh/MocA family oxidoreductase [Paracoccaceae bacterium]|nr:Gfo/Idh/MocA family oxidoreductase [Paracoccaceae bacterium]